MTEIDSAPRYSNAILLPLLGSEEKPFTAGGAEGGVFDCAHKPIEHAFLIRQYRQGAKLVAGKWDTTTGQSINTSQMNLPRDIEPCKERLDGCHIFAGYLFPHYGHFLLESLSRLWFIKKHPEIPLVWLGVHNQSTFNEIQRQLFDLYGLQNPMRLVTEPTEVETLIVPHDGYIIHTRYSDEQRKALTLQGAKDCIPGKKVWLSRSRLDRAIVFNEPALEEILAENGWTIFHPQEHSIRAQLDMLADAEHIAGVEGSALHTLVLMPEYKGKVTIFARGRKVIFDYCLIAEAAGINQRIISPPRMKWSDGLKHWESNWIWSNLDVLLAELGAKRQAKPWHPLPKSLENVTRSIIGFYKKHTCVELWPRTNSVAAVCAPARAVAVGPSLPFDLAPLKDAGATYMEVTADQYFTTRPFGGVIDLFCFRQQDDASIALRAFNASLTLASLKSIWIIDGGNPVNEQLLAWIYDYHPTLSVARVRNSDIAIVWRASRHMFKPVHETLDVTAPDFRAKLAKLPLNDIATLISKQGEKQEKA
ncbi:glycosyltransferase family 61 protein [Kordiimonas aestuarii]|uniref:glycosyltransferase family 61 protein n=1 Tax=Kordiimonas aestuarii TaxID=1005925 RepID=UPI0021D05FBD|nr:glycosyltransferase family 61 protein [Kordiimonas aestuarii]